MTTKGICLIPGCTHPAVSYLCPDHWQALPAKIQKRWWAETEYSKHPPGEELRTLIVRTIEERR